MIKLLSFLEMKSLVLVLFSVVSSVKYLLYDVNPGEGFNLRRDVYIRVSNLVKGMNENGKEYKLVLPPWGNIGYHWGHGEKKIEWGHFFNLDAMRKHVDVIEFEELEIFRKKSNHTTSKKIFF